MVLKMGAGVAVDALGQLTDTTDDSIVAAVKRAARGEASVAEVLGARARAAGSSWLVEVEVVPDRFVVSASAMDHLAANVQRAVIASVPDVTECLAMVHTGAFRGPAAALLPTPRMIDKHVRETVEHAPGNLAVSRTVAHFAGAKPSVEVWVDVSQSCTLAEGAATAAAARDALIASEAFDVVQIHAELASNGVGRR
uniref:Cation efflux protein cytoplasmic domain-containing protein n=1 Tax=Zooxanthella nutricula TaxID=1333877 RepID=A0A7S2QIL7_9DINO